MSHRCHSPLLLCLPLPPPPLPGPLWRKRAEAGWQADRSHCSDSKGETRFLGQQSGRAGPEPLSRLSSTVQQFIPAVRVYEPELSVSQGLHFQPPKVSLQRKSSNILDKRNLSFVSHWNGQKSKIRQELSLQTHSG